ncbi:MAG: MBL fold metallo-hydrolase [Solirubrobacteraceae bacterium]|nr:MAG: MBL fold metallo-hydrolase [Solirubrobacterales bacterium]
MAEIEPIDVMHLGRERVICCWRVDDVLIDPGPESSSETLIAALAGFEPRALLLTHIHFDHAGAAGALARRWPALEIYVHEAGASHLADPERLVASARRLYGADFDRLWGAVVPIPAERLSILRGGETIHGCVVEATPGHARHHVCFFHRDSGRAFVGDTAGVRIPPCDYTLAPTPPPDIDLEAWERSLRTIERHAPASLGLTHFGLVEDVPAQLEALRGWLARWGPEARALEPGDFERRLREQIAEGCDAGTAAVFQQAAPAEQLYLGLRRYWDQQAGAANESFTDRR